MYFSRGLFTHNKLQGTFRNNKAPARLKQQHTTSHIEEIGLTDLFNSTGNITVGL